MRRWVIGWVDFFFVREEERSPHGGAVSFLTHPLSTRVGHPTWCFAPDTALAVRAVFDLYEGLSGLAAGIVHEEVRREAGPYSLLAGYGAWVRDIE